MKNNYCKQCGLMYRLWIHKAELNVCDECEPEKFASLHKQNIYDIKKKSRGQEHISEHHHFPRQPTMSEYNTKDKYRREVK
jgi:ribosome-binding protein aMBF1 (putative translation factor)